MENNQEKISLWNKVKIVFGTLLALLVILLVIMNWFSVPINLVVKTINMPLTLIILISLITGYIWGTISTNRSQKIRKN